MSQNPHYEKDEQVQLCDDNVEMCLIGRTIKIRLRSPLHCEKGYEACHMAGLNLMKVFFDEEEWTTRRCTCEATLVVITKLINDPDNMVCCPYLQNHTTDISNEKAVIRALRNKRRVTLTADQQVMLSQFKRLLLDIQNELRRRRVGESRAINSILERITEYENK
jgi:hypothetical protein